MGTETSDVLKSYYVLRTVPSQLSPEIFDPRKVDPKFLEASFEYFILLSARDDENG